MSERKTIIRTVGLKKHYTVGGNTVRALDGVDMSVLQGEFVCVAGRSGSGKSTMLNMLAGLEPPTEGEIIVRGKHHLEAMDEEQRTRFRRRYIGFVFQSYNNLPQYTALENVALPLAIRGVPEDERNWLAWQALSRVGLRGHVDHRPAELSGGQHDVPPFLDIDRYFQPGDATGHLSLPADNVGGNGSRGMVSAFQAETGGRRHADHGGRGQQ